MRQAKKTKIYKLSLFLLGLTVLINFSFCLMPPDASAQIPDGFTEPNPHISHSGSNKDESCEVVTDSSTKEVSDLQKTIQNNGAKNSGTILPCCFDHNKITKIDNASNFKINDLQFYAILNNTDLDYKAESQNSSYVHSLNLPPPRADVLFSVIKKE
ncbi:MAG: hypothetical protein ACD_15C00138G0011 [uncultured bacterium]|nr:MAG: hypothetical protein ACD_15C00138G0011 [uncultured bacterium]